MSDELVIKPKGYARLSPLLRGRIADVMSAGALVAAIVALFTGAEISGVWVRVGSSRVDLQACKLEYSIVSPK